MSANEKLSLGTIVVSLVSFFYYFLQVTQGGVLMEMETATLGWLLLKIVVVVVIAETVLAIVVWSRPNADKEQELDEREKSNETRATRNAYWVMHSLLAFLIFGVFLDQAYGVFGSYSPSQINGLVFILISTVSIAELVYLLSIIVYGFR